MQRLIHLLAILSVFILGTATNAMAEAPRWYEVELALISYQDKDKIDHENWPEILVADQEINPLDEQTSKETNEPWQWLKWWNQPTSPKGLFDIQKHSINQHKVLETPFLGQGLAFVDKTEKFEKAKDLQVIWSKKWRQPIPEKDGAINAENLINIDIKTALNFKQALTASSPLIEIEVKGNLHLYRSRYLHLVSDLKVQHWQSLASNGALDKSINVLPSHTKSTDNIIPSNSSTPLTAITEVPLRAAIIKQSRRMRSKELHYIDHPMLGILIRTTPIE